MQQKLGIFTLLVAIVVISVLLFLVSRAPKKPGPGSTPIPRTEVAVVQDGFSPQTLKIKKGDTVVWINKSTGNVNVSSDPHPTHNLHRLLNKGEFPPGSSVQVTFQAAGTFGYHNHLNPSQKGTIVVE